MSRIFNFKIISCCFSGYWNINHFWFIHFDYIYKNFSFNFNVNYIWILANYSCIFNIRYSMAMGC